MNHFFPYVFVQAGDSIRDGHVTGVQTCALPICAPDGPGTSEPVDLNNADAAALQTLPGIGPALADRILAHRRDNGPFGSVDDLMAVSGIGPATFARLRELVAV